MRTSSSNVSAAAWWPPPRHATPRPAGAGSARPSTSTPSPPSSAASAPGTCATRTATCASRRGRPGAGRLRRPAAAAGHRPGVLELAGGIHRLGPRAGRSGTRLCVRLAPDREPVERRGDGVLAPARVRQQERHPLSVVLYPAPERADPAVRPFPADPRPRRIRRWARSPVFDAERAIGVHLLSPSPWADHTSPFGIASIKWHKSWSGTGGYLGWNDDLAPTLPG